MNGERDSRFVGCWVLGNSGEHQYDDEDDCTALFFSGSSSSSLLILSNPSNPNSKKSLSLSLKVSHGIVSETMLNGGKKIVCSTCFVGC